MAFAGFSRAARALSRGSEDRAFPGWKRPPPRSFVQPSLRGGSRCRSGGTDSEAGARHCRSDGGDLLPDHRQFFPVDPAVPEARRMSGRSDCPSGGALSTLRKE